mmetsp:Transcript_8476/g.10402  ORF Transcript_8476/g.10402 Transcript_8476/m.10402 type:complete len:141 (+) Transcript_8476:171-593(+)
MRASVVVFMVLTMRLRVVIEEVRFAVVLRHFVAVIVVIMDNVLISGVAARVMPSSVAEPVVSGIVSANDIVVVHIQVAVLTSVVVVMVLPVMHSVVVKHFSISVLMACQATAFISMALNVTFISVVRIVTKANILGVVFT